MVTRNRRRGWQKFLDTKEGLWAVRLTEQNKVNLENLAYAHNMSAAAVVRYLIDHAVPSYNTSENALLYNLTLDEQAIKDSHMANASDYQNKMLEELKQVAEFINTHSGHGE